MVLSDEKKKEYVKRLLMSRMRLLINNGFYGLLLMHMIYSIDENCETAATDGKQIFFGPKFLDELSDSELDFIMMHEILHVVLQHCMRQGDYDSEQFNIACDIVVNSNILLSNNMNRNSIKLKKYGESMHIAPDGKEGYEYTAEQIYGMLPPPPKNRKPKPALTGTHGETGDDDIEGKGSAPGRAKQIQGKKQMHRQFGMITPGGVNMRKTTLSEMCGSNVLKMLAKQYQYVIRLIKEGSFLCLPNVYSKNCASLKRIGERY